MKDKATTFQEPFLVNLSNLCIYQNHSFVNNLYKNNFDPNILSKTILLKWTTDEKGQKYLIDILTNTKIYLLTKHIDKNIVKLKKANICYLVTTPYHYNYSGLSNTKKYFHDLPNALAVDIKNIKPITLASKEENQSLQDYPNNNVQPRIKYIETLKNIQYEQFQNNLNYSETEIVKQHIAEITDDFSSFSHLLKAKQKKLTKNIYLKK